MIILGEPNMKCPKCGTEMEEENVPLVTSLKCTGSSNNDPIFATKIPSKHYRCDDCDSEYLKVGSQNLEKISEAGRGFAKPLDYVFDGEGDSGYSEEDEA